MQAALERLPPSLLQASADLGARPRQTFRYMVLPLAIPGIAAGSIFTFSLTLGDFYCPAAGWPSRIFYRQYGLFPAGAIGNMPMAAAFTTVPIVLIALYGVRETSGSVRCTLNAHRFPQTGGLGRRGFPTFSHPDYRCLCV